jgi:hypothetical protein
LQATLGNKEIEIDMQGLPDLEALKVVNEKYQRIVKVDFREKMFLLNPNNIKPS